MCLVKTVPYSSPAINTTILKIVVFGRSALFIRFYDMFSSV